MNDIAILKNIEASLELMKVCIENDDIEEVETIRKELANFIKELL